MSTRRRTFVQLQPRHPGISNGMEWALRFLLWSMALRKEPSAKDIQQQFDVSRATAYRWLQALRDARAKHPGGN